ncbi:helix-turn-helix domain-containing protein [bacterium]|nr:helix-turn-helix domain-containing protein [bacterium]
MDIGQTLKQKRDSLNKSLVDLHRETRISVEHLQYLEDNNFTFLPDMYVRSFLKNYSNALELDADEILGSLSNPHADPEHKGNKKETAAEQRSSASQTPQLLEWSLVFAAVVLLVGIAFAYFQYRAQISTRTESRPAGFSQANLRNTTTHKDVAPFELRINQSEADDVRLFIDDQDVTDQMLPDNQTVLRITEGEFEILMKDARALQFQLQTEEIKKVVSSGKPVRLTFKRESSNGKH